MPFKFQTMEIPDVVLVQPEVFGDSRGFFLELFKSEEFEKHGIPKFVQANHSRSSKGVLRGLHYQAPPEAQGKLVYVTRGSIFDVALDIRRSSPAYGQWVGVDLDAEKKHMLYVPEGFAHGFCVTSETAEVIYFCTREYSPESEGGIMWNDPALNIPWPVSDPALSERDKRYSFLENLISPF